MSKNTNIVSAMYKGKKISCEKITEDNLAECREKARVGHYGSVEVGKYLYWAGSGYDYFYLVLNGNDLEFI